MFKEQGVARETIRGFPLIFGVYFCIKAFIKGQDSFGGLSP